MIGDAVFDKLDGGGLAVDHQVFKGAQELGGKIAFHLQDGGMVHQFYLADAEIVMADGIIDLGDQAARICAV